MQKIGTEEMKTMPQFPAPEDGWPRWRFWVPSVCSSRAREHIIVTAAQLPCILLSAASEPGLPSCFPRGGRAWDVHDTTQERPGSVRQLH